MENASRALLMAATVLISVMVISLGTYLFATFGNYSKQINSNLSSKQKQEFNAQFTKYEGGDPCTVYDIVTVINLAKNSNSQYEEYQDITKKPNDYKNNSNAYIYVEINEEHNINETSDTTNLNNFIENDVNENKKYTCTVNVNEQTDLVKSITFTQK